MLPPAPGRVLNLRLTPEDHTNLTTIAGVLRRSVGQPFANRSDAARAALRVAAQMAEGGSLADALKDYRAGLAA